MATVDQFVLEDMTIVKLSGALGAEGIDDVERQFAQATEREGVIDG